MTDEICGHEGCKCAPREADAYCSDYCAKHGSHEGHQAHECGCAHAECVASEPSPA